MKTLIIYDSLFGNTAQVARAVAGCLETIGTVRSVLASEASDADLAGVGLLVIGGPTQGHGQSPLVRAWVDRTSSEALHGIDLATFDTRLHWSTFLSGSAAQAIARALQRKGARLIAPPESFFVQGKEGPLLEGELERAEAWADTLVFKVGVGPAPAANSNHAL
jgi:flavodoxin